MTRNELIGIVAVSSFLIGIYYYRTTQINNILTHGKKTVGTISQVGGKNLTVIFKANGAACSNVLSVPYYNLYEGEKYMLMYDSMDTKLTVMLFDEPIFDRSEYSVTVTTDARELWESSCIKYRYKVADKEFTRFRELKSTEKFVKSDSIRVFYNSRNPHIAYLDF